MRQESAPGSLRESIGAWSAAAGLHTRASSGFPGCTTGPRWNIITSCPAGRNRLFDRFMPTVLQALSSTRLDPLVGTQQGLYPQTAFQTQAPDPPVLYRVQRALSATGHGAPLIANKRLPSSSARPSPPSAVNCSSPRAVAFGVAPLGNMHIPIMYIMALFVPLVSATLPNWFPLKPAYSHLVVKHIGACDNKNPCQVILGGPCDICGCEIPRKKLFYQCQLCEGVSESHIQSMCYIHRYQPGSSGNSSGSGS
ncbi:hypothetical protein PCASD_02842 [Puccinia coronata f. sp. avenae]|uniref:Uncharacterized protein n=1 Tax=Puccinia coronata f. sp. avenae TaxID=200324 RepID=A0A2N5VFY1_9BASI|nr:hypothetical protein PCASD_02842 [Puccinia coronata f. sp. avenae]